MLHSAIEISYIYYLTSSFPKDIHKHFQTHFPPKLNKYAITFERKFDSENLKA